MYIRDIYAINTKEVFRMIAPHRKIVQLSALLTTAVVMAACSPNEIAPNTGSIETEGQTGALADSEIKVGRDVFANTSLNARSAPEVGDNVVGKLGPNDKVQIVDAKVIGANKFIGVQVQETSGTIPAGQTVYVSADYLNPTRTASELKSEVFVVTNIATEKVRVYKRCAPGEGCLNKVIFEQDVVAGEDEGGTRTDVGTYTVKSWTKFYETSPYPAWYRPGYPAVPRPGADRTDWFASKYMARPGQQMRGAFGWYTVMVGPNPNGQWMHGTAGWGADKKNFILFKDSFWGGIVNLFTSIRSHGCTRIDNESIAYIRQIVPPGSVYVKLYAKEAARNPNQAKATASWNYILTKNGYGAVNNHQLADRNQVLSAGTPRDQWIEEGTLTYSTTAKAVTGDVYRLRNFKGVYVVDEGTTVDYQHPAGISVGGQGRSLPAFMISNDRNYVAASGSGSSGPSSSGGGSSWGNTGVSYDYGDPVR